MTQSRAFHLLIVDDDPLIHQSLKLILPPQWKAYSARSLAEVTFERVYHLAFVDMHLTGNIKIASGLEVVSALALAQPQLDIVAMSGNMSRELMESCLKKGAQRFLSKPLMQDEVLLIIEKIEALHSLRNFETSKMKTQWIGKSSSTEKITKKIASLKGEMAPVLIEAETGSGKDVVARLLHEQEPERPFISVNIASIHDHLFESEMFGHVKGAFTGADQNKIGLTEAAHGGDLFLDEIEALSVQHQVKLLRFLESGEIRKVGSKENQKIKTRIIVASNRSLEEMVKSGEFREDLYFRLSAHRIMIPPLRERTDDIDALADFFLKMERPRRNKTFTADGIESLKNYKWPGNTRELKRVCEQLSLISPLPIIRGEDVRDLLKMDKNSLSTSQEIDLSKGLAKLVEEFEVMVIRTVLKKNSNKLDGVLEDLKISRSTFYKKMKDLNIEEET